MVLSLLSAVLINNFWHTLKWNIFCVGDLPSSLCPLYECSCQQVKIFVVIPQLLMYHSTLNKSFIFNVKASAEYLDFIGLNVVSIFFYWSLSGWKRWGHSEARRTEETRRQREYDEGGTDNTVTRDRLTITQITDQTHFYYIPLYHHSAK